MDEIVEIERQSHTSDIGIDRHPLRKIRVDFDAAYSRLASAFETSYGSTGNPSVPTPVLLRARLLMALSSIRSERALCEQITMNAGFRWFVGHALVDSASA